MPKTFKDLDDIVVRIEALARDSPASQPLKQLAAGARAELDGLKKAAAGDTAAEIKAVETSGGAIVAKEVAAQLAGAGGVTTGTTVPPIVGMAAVASITVLMAAFLIWYVNGIGYDRLSVVETARPLLVIAAVISTITFGGAMLFGALFSSDGTFEDRYRRAREIFLVFSGVFGTVMGFYFGAGDSSGSGLGLDAIVEGQTVVAHATAGQPPYSFSLVYGKGKVPLSAVSTNGLAQFDLKSPKECPEPVEITVIDAKKQSTTRPVPLAEGERARWALCQAGAAVTTTTTSTLPSRQ